SAVFLLNRSDGAAGDDTATTLPSSPHEAITLLTLLL
ncbi:uncharacterized, partial [Tachysurus ichikawai]